jgi:KDO2-lipid IV(A) lauroyltransferase
LTNFPRQVSPINDITAKMGSVEIPLYRFWQPNFWPLWAGIALLRVLSFLPYKRQMQLGRALGRIIYRALPERRNIAAVNLRLCFPEFDDNEIQALLKKHFESLGMGVFELALAWWATDEEIASLVRLEGLEHIKNSTAKGQGVVVLSGHFSATELTGRAVRLNVPIDAAVYRPMRNPLVDQLVRRGRRGAARGLIPKDGIRQMIRALKGGSTIWYASDQSYDRKYSAMVPFFDEPAMTNAALTHIARISNAAVVFYVPHRLADDAGYHAELFPPLDDFPTDDPATDASRVNKLLEDSIRRAPDEYYWIHRRFKGRPEPYPDPYADCGDPGMN